MKLVKLPQLEPIMLILCAAFAIKQNNFWTNFILKDPRRQAGELGAPPPPMWTELTPLFSDCRTQVCPSAPDLLLGLVSLRLLKRHFFIPMRIRQSLRFVDPRRTGKCSKTSKFSWCASENPMLRSQHIVLINPLSDKLILIFRIAGSQRYDIRVASISRVW